MQPPCQTQDQIPAVAPRNRRIIAAQACSWRRCAPARQRSYQRLRGHSGSGESASIGPTGRTVAEVMCYVVAAGRAIRATTTRRRLPRRARHGAAAAPACLHTSVCSQGLCCAANAGIWPHWHTVLTPACVATRDGAW